MKIWIVYDSKYGSNKRVATLMQEILSPRHDVRIAYAKDIRPKAILADFPDALLFGGPRRMGKMSYTIRKWAEGFAKALQKQGKQMDRVAAWETRGEMKPEAANAESKMDRDIYQANLKTGELWAQLIAKVPVARPPPPLLSLSIVNETALGNGTLEPEFEAKVRDFIRQFDAP